MKVENLITKLDSHYSRIIRSKLGQQIVSWEVGDETITVDETVINRCNRICLRNVEDTVFLYAVYIFRDDENYNRHYKKFELSEIEEVILET